jgi:hypothetical protein
VKTTVKLSFAGAIDTLTVRTTESVKTTVKLSFAGAVDTLMVRMDTWMLRGGRILTAGTIGCMRATSETERAREVERLRGRDGVASNLRWRR